MAARAARRRAGLNPVALLAGRWTVRRKLHDRRLGQRGAFEGVADFVPDGDGLRWTERGRMRFGAHDGPAWRELRIVPADAGWEVRFADGRPFHPLDLEDGEVLHPCGEDRYVGRYAFDGDDVLRVRWEVTGPEADERLEAVYRRSS